MSVSQRILLTGASGFIGSRLADTLRGAGHDVSRLVRRAPIAPGEYQWDPYQATIDDRALKGLDVVINLSGAGIGDKRWSTARKTELYDSRIVTTRVLSEALASHEDPPTLFISQSAIGIYGDRGDEVLTEASPLGPRDDFLAALTADWEAAADPAREAGIRVIHPRTGLVLSRQAQLMRRLLPMFKAGLGGPIGDGTHWWSWIALEDVVGSLDHLMASDLTGPVNLVAPVPVTQREFADTLAAELNRPSRLLVPRFGMRVVLGSEKANSIGFASTRVIPSRLEEDGYRFASPQLAPALRRMLA